MSNPIVNAAGRVIYEPWAGPQETFWDFTGRYGLYGGSGFTGKTDLLRWYPWQQIQAEDARLKAGEHMEQSSGHALVLRRETPQLRELMNRCRRDFEQANPSIKWVATDKTWEWPNGYRYTVGHMENEDDWMKYQGWQISCLCLDEGTTFTEKQFSMIDAWVRQPKGSHLTPIIRLGSNPVGAGLKWVRKFFVEAGYEKEEAKRYWGKPIVKELEVPVVNDAGVMTIEKRLVARIFVPARVSDNKSVDQGDYASTLVDKPDYIRKAILEGDWYAISEDTWVSGMFDTAVHICKPFKIPAHWPKFRAGSFAAAWPKYSSFQWYASDSNGDLVCYRSMCAAGANAREQAEMIKDIEIEANEWDMSRDCSKLTGPLNPECFPKEDQVGPTIEETFRDVGVFWNKATKDLSHAAEQIRVRLKSRNEHPKKKGKDGKPLRCVPGVRWFDTCHNVIKSPNGEKVNVGPAATIPELPADDKGTGLWVKNGTEHDMNAVAFACSSRPQHASENAIEDEDFPKGRRSPSNPFSTGGYW